MQLGLLLGKLLTLLDAQIQTFRFLGLFLRFFKLAPRFPTFRRHGFLSMASSLGLRGFHRLFGCLIGAFKFGKLRFSFLQDILRLAYLVTLPLYFTQLFGDLFQFGQLGISLFNGLLSFLDAVPLGGFALGFQLGLGPTKFRLCPMQLLRTLLGMALQGMYFLLGDRIIGSLIGTGVRGAAAYRARLPFFQHAGVFRRIQHGEFLPRLFGCLFRLGTDDVQFIDLSVLFSDTLLEFYYFPGMSEPLHCLFTLLLKQRFLSKLFGIRGDTFSDRCLVRQFLHGFLRRGKHVIPLSEVPGTRFFHALGGLGDFVQRSLMRCNDRKSLSGCVLTSGRSQRTLMPFFQHLGCGILLEPFQYIIQIVDSVLQLATALLEILLLGQHWLRLASRFDLVPFRCDLLTLTFQIDMLLHQRTFFLCLLHQISTLPILILRMAQLDFQLGCLRCKVILQSSRLHGGLGHGLVQSFNNLFNAVPRVCDVAGFVQTPKARIHTCRSTGISLLIRCLRYRVRAIAEFADTLQNTTGVTLCQTSSFG